MRRVFRVVFLIGVVCMAASMVWIQFNADFNSLVRSLSAETTIIARRPKIAKHVLVGKEQLGQDTNNINNYNLGVNIHGQSTQILQVEIFPDWTTSDPHDKIFTRRVYLYSAFLSIHGTPPTGSDVHIIAFQDGRHDLGLQCCFMREGQPPVLTGPAFIDFQRVESETELNYNDTKTIGIVYRCHVPFDAQEMGAGHVTVTPTSCPEKKGLYLPVGVPETRTGGLALCGKVAYGHDLNPQKLVEWFEMQRLLGVEKIVIFDLNNTRTVLNIFQHYQQSGLLDLLPYKLPGRPWGHQMTPSQQGPFDQTLPLWDCRLRLAGYSYVISVDMDEIIMPRRTDQLKPFFEEQFAGSDNASALYFYVQFFVSAWEPTDPSAPLIFLRYRRSTLPRKECYKYVYIPARTHQVRIHRTFPYRGYRQYYFVDSQEATIFHYRKCRKEWKSLVCSPLPNMTDHSMLRFRDRLVPNVMATLKDVGLPIA